MGGTALSTNVCKLFITSVNFTILCKITGLFHHVLQWLNIVKSSSIQLIIDDPFEPFVESMIVSCSLLHIFNKCQGRRWFKVRMLLHLLGDSNLAVVDS